MKFCFKITMLLFYPILLVSLGCSEKEESRTSDYSTDPPSDEKIAETNNIREEYGIRQIKKNWSFNYREFGIERWKDERGFPCKHVRYDKNYEQILSEHDFYYTGRTYPCLDPDGGREHNEAFSTFLSKYESEALEPTAPLRIQIVHF